MSISVKLAVFFFIQTAGTLAAIACYYAYLAGELRSFRSVFAILGEDTRKLHRMLDHPDPLGTSGRERFGAFAAKVEAANRVLKVGGRFEGIACKPIPPELKDLFDEAGVRWKRTRRELLDTASAAEAGEMAARKKLHDVFPYWQATISRMQQSLDRREGTIHAQMKTTIGLIGGVNLIFFCLVLWLARRQITQPVQAVQAAAARVASGDYAAQAPADGNDEIAALGAGFNRMSAQLQETVSALEKSNRELEQYAYAASHDLQEPLRTVSLYAQMLAQRCELPPEALHFTSQIQSSAQRMQRLVADLLEHSRSVHESARSVPADANHAVAEVISYLDEEIVSTGAVIEREPLPFVLAGGPDLELVFRNLIANALKYRGEAVPKIHIGAETANGLCTFSVRDNGIGIKPEYFERVFGLFKRLHGPEVPGTGVGLAVAKNVVEKHGGRIWVESAPGQGTTFRFQLPLAVIAAASGAGR